MYEQSEMSDMTFFIFQHRVDNITDTNLTFADSDSFSLSTRFFPIQLCLSSLDQTDSQSQGFKITSGHAHFNVVGKSRLLNILNYI